MHKTDYFIYMIMKVRGNNLLDIDELMALDQRLKEELEEKQTAILTRLNRDGRLIELLNLMGLSSLLNPQAEYRFEPLRLGKILVLGNSRVRKEELLGVANSLGISKNRVECFLEYGGYNIEKLRYNPDYVLVMVGPIPHSDEGKGDHSSILTAMENTDGYPKILRLGSGELKISKSGFRDGLQEAIGKGLLKTG